MDLGAAVCLPRNPECESCPVSRLCEAKRRGQQAQLPVRARRMPLRRVVLGVAVISRHGTGATELAAVKGAARRHVGVSQRRNSRSTHGCDGRAETTTRGDPRNVEAASKATSATYPGPPRLLSFRGDGAGLSLRPWLRRDSSRLPLGERSVSLSRYPMGKVDRKIADSVMHDHELDWTRGDTDKRQVRGSPIGRPVLGSKTSNGGRADTPTRCGRSCRVIGDLLGAAPSLCAASCQRCRLRGRAARHRAQADDLPAIHCGAHDGCA